MSIAWDYLSPIQKAQIKHLRPDLIEQKFDCPEIQLTNPPRCKLHNGKTCIRDMGYPCQTYEEFLREAV